MTAGKYFIKIILDIKIEIDIKCAKFLSIFNFGTNLDLTGSNNFINFIFSIKVGIGIFEISNVPNFNKFQAFLILEPIWA